MDWVQFMAFTIVMSLFLGWDRWKDSNALYRIETKIDQLRVENNVMLKGIYDEITRVNEIRRKFEEVDSYKKKTGE